MGSGGKRVSDLVQGTEFSIMYITDVYYLRRFEWGKGDTEKAKWVWWIQVKNSCKMVSGMNLAEQVTPGKEALELKMRRDRGMCYS